MKLQRIVLHLGNDIILINERHYFYYTKIYFRKCLAVYGAYSRQKITCKTSPKYNALILALVDYFDLIFTSVDLFDQIFTSIEFSY